MSHLAMRMYSPGCDIVILRGIGKLFKKILNATLSIVMSNFLNATNFNYDASTSTTFAGKPSSVLNNLI